MRSQKDPIFSDICDRVGNGTDNETDLRYLRSRVKNTENEKSNRNFKSGKVSIIVTTNKRRQQINEEKLNLLLPNEKLYVFEAKEIFSDRKWRNKIPKNTISNHTCML